MAVTTSTAETITRANELLAEHAALILRVRTTQQNQRRQLHSLQSPPHELLRLPLISSRPSSPVLEDDESPPSSPILQPAIRQDLPPAKRARVARYHNYVPEEETIRNDYSQRYVDGGEWPQNWVLGAEPERRFEEYPKQQRLLSLKKASVNQCSLPPSYLAHSELASLHPAKFDVILLDPPFSSSYTWDHLQELPIPSLAADPSFVFLWVGSGAGEGLERGREVLAKWGYRRCEDVVWVKTNKITNQGPGTDPPTTSLLTRTKQHCLIGIRGTVRRSTDSWFVHCNVDTDVIIWEGDPDDPTRKPPEMYTLIENFCLGIRRLEIFGKPSSLRRGWVTVLGSGHDEHLPIHEGVVRVGGDEGGIASKWMPEAWDEGIRELSSGNKPVVPMTADIDALRPKSPPRPGNNNNSNNHTGPPQGMNNVANNRFPSGNRGGFMGNTGGMANQLMGQGPQMLNPMMGMGAHQMGMGMTGMDEMMGGWNPMMNGMGGMGVGGMGGMGNRVSGGMANNAMTGLGNPAMAAGMAGASMGGSGVGGNMGNVGMGNMPMQMMGQMGMGNAFQVQGAGGFGPGGGMPVFNNAMNGWNEQGQFGMEGGWDQDAAMMGMNVPGMVGGMGMGNMGMNPGMGMGQQWGGSGNF